MLRTSYRILIADDNAVNQKLFQRILVKMNHKVESVYSGYEVLQSLQKNQYDFILMDIQMPGLDGLMTTSHIIATSDPMNRPVIIAITANAKMCDRETCLRAGMDDYLSKPIIIEDLEDKLYYWGHHRMKGQSIQNKQIISNNQPSPLISIQRINKLLALQSDRSELLELYHIFISQCQEQLRRLQCDWDQNNVESMIDCAHSLRGACLNFGALQVADLSETLEFLLLAEEWNQIPNMLDQLKTSITLSSQKILNYIQVY